MNTQVTDIKKDRQIHGVAADILNRERKIIYLKDDSEIQRKVIVDCRIVCGTVCACASKKK